MMLLVHLDNLGYCLVENILLLLEDSLGLCYLRLSAFDEDLNIFRWVFSVSGVRNVDLRPGCLSKLIHPASTLADQRRHLVTVHRDRGRVRVVFEILEQGKNLISRFVRSLFRSLNNNLVRLLFTSTVLATSLTGGIGI